MAVPETNLASVAAFLRDAGLAVDDEHVVPVALAGGVASDIFRVDLAAGSVCVKRALPKLKVAQDWRAPVERNDYEVAWFEYVHHIAPEAVPEVLAHNPQLGMFAMPYLEPESHPLWKDELRAGRADPAFAAKVGAVLGRIHASTAGDPAVAEAFPTDAIFHAIRLEPYLEATARAHPDVGDALMALSRVTGETHHALVHGDVSPKNILVGGQGPVLLDAECAWYGDPAFDLAFCLNHLVLKCLWVPAAAERFLASFEALGQTYLGVTQGVLAGVEARAARLLPGLMLARVDGKSPVEYLTGDEDKERVRRAARALLVDPPVSLSDIRIAWSREISKG